MLDIHQKIDFFKKYLSFKNGSYSDSIKDEIYNYFFEIIGDSTEIENFLFLNNLIDENEIKNKVELLVSKIILHEHHAGTEDLIAEYTL
jgi:hypothetical protein